MTRGVFSLIFIVGLTVTSVYAHHSFAATYAEEKTIKIEGKLVQFNFRNPHSFVQIEVKDENGMVERWSVEWGGAGQLGAQGLTRDTLRPGDQVIITGHPGRNNNEDHRLRMLEIRRPLDGWKWGGTYD
jgi:hypothetical protein